MRDSAPLPAAARRPSPSRGEGDAAGDAGSSLPSPLEGEGADRRSAGEGVPEFKWKRPAASLRLRTFAKGMRSQPTSAEDRMWRLLRARRFEGYKFRRQVPIGNYIVDFVCQAARLIVELDGSQHAGDPSDLRRDRWLTGQGYRILRVWNNELTGNEAGVMTAIWAALQEQAH